MDFCNFLFLCDKDFVKYVMTYAMLLRKSLKAHERLKIPPQSKMKYVHSKQEEIGKLVDPREAAGGGGLWTHPKVDQILLIKFVPRRNNF